MNTYALRDKDFGIIRVRVGNALAKRISLRIREGQILATLPVGVDPKRLLTFIDEQRSALKEALLKARKAPAYDEQSELQTNTFRLHIFRAERDNFYMQLKDGVLHIACPMATDFAETSVQAIIKSFIGRALRHEAKRVLPARLERLAGEYGFSYNGLRIADTKTRWGSCSAGKHINLSLSLMLLPDRLMDYVLLHELCHTREMNHGPRFWALMDSVTGGQARALRKEMRNYTTRLF
ncbi:MAG: M48 family metallopeptidase [Tannerella sp.]|nr:M48 family metallopeptidase [Tannerella sp.]